MRSDRVFARVRSQSLQTGFFKLFFSSQALLVLLLGSVPSLAQTTQGLISGRLINSVTGRAIAEANVEYSSDLTNFTGISLSDGSGYYYLPLLSPGFYRVRVTANGYQSQE